MLRLALVFFALVSFALGRDASPDLQAAYSRYWSVLRPGLDKYFVPENELLRLELQDKGTFTPEFVARRKSECYALTELVLFTDWKKPPASVLARRKKMDEDLSLLSGLSFWAISAERPAGQIEIYKAYSRLVNDLDAIKADDQIR